MKSSGKSERYFLIFRIRELKSLLATVMMLMMLPWPALAIDISDTPLDAQINPAAPNFMMGLDDSGSMDWEVMVDTSDGLFPIGNTSYEYVFDDPSDENLYQTNLYSDIIEGSNRLYFRSQWAEYNYVYYNPTITYKPWLKKKETGDTDYPRMANADPNTPRHHPYYANDDNTYINLSNNYVSLTASSDDDIIVDDDSRLVETTGSWESNRTDSWTYQIGATLKWKPSVSTAGRYEVKIFNYSYSGNDTNAKYTIVHRDGTTDVYKSQVGGNDWTSLGVYYFNTGTNGTITVSRTSASGGDYTNADLVKLVPQDSGAVTIPNAHYYVKSASQNKMYLVTLKDSIQYYAINDDGDNKLEIGEAVLTTSPPSDVVTGRSYTDERQNFANWYQYHRKRMYTAIASICEVIPRLKGVNVGIRSINSHIKKAVVPVQVGGVDRAGELLQVMNQYRQSDFGSGASTPLREGLDQIARYYDTRTGTNYDLNPRETEFDGSPLSLGAAGECQQNFVMMFSDGSDNGGAAGMGNADGDQGQPYADDASGTLADIAMYYYKTDLSPTVDNKVPANGVDNAPHQHLVTYTVGFGVKGNLNPDDYVLYPTPGKTVRYPVWPSPVNDDQKKIDDMWHAAVNGRGKYLNAKSPQELLDAFNEVVSDVLSRIGSGASVSINGEELNVGNSRLYQSSYSSNEWSGDVKAYSLTATGARGTMVWSANEKLNARNWDTGRKIVTYNNSSDAGAVFRFNSLTDSQKTALGYSAAVSGSDTKATNVLNYLRGDWTNEVSSTVAGTKEFRDRVVRDEQGAIVRDHNKLGDIVHSAPVYLNNVIYVGANDGMMHALNAADGEEIFAYVPNQVYSNLKSLSSPAYTHKYYVDMSPFVRKIDGGSSYLVGALGKGGKGIYCLDVTNAGGTIADESAATAMVKWEFPKIGPHDPQPAAGTTDKSNIDDMGFTFSKPYIVKVKYGDSTKWVVMFGNGYNSTNGKAVLFILDLLTGALIKKIDTGVGSDNGLSTLNIVDVDGDGISDYAYAGDLKGNMWKFYFRTGDTAAWRVAYEKDSKPAPLFTAIGPSPANNIQSVTARPDVMLHCKVGLPGYIVVFGTGRYLGLSDLSNTEKQTLYGLWDYGDDADKSEFLGSFNRTGSPTLSNQARASLLAQTQIYYGSAVTLDATTGTEVTASNIVRIISDNKPVWLTQDDATAGQKSDPSTTAANNAGWYFDLPNSGERMIQDVLIRDGLALIISSTPNPSNPCTGGGESVYHEIDACSGGRLARSHFNMNSDSKVDTKDLVKVGDQWYSPAGVHYPNMIYPPVIMRTADGIELKLLGTSVGTLATVGTEAETRGIFYWRSY